VATVKGEKHRKLRDFLKESFRPKEFEIFLRDHGCAEVAGSVNDDAAGEDYFFDVIEALDHRGLVDGRFFDRLTAARSNKVDRVRVLRECWLESVTSDQEVEVSVSRLRQHAGILIGREGAQERLDTAWANAQTHVVVVHAWGGVGKTSLVATWRASMALKDWDGARRVFDWSFYDLGTHAEGDAEYQGASSDRFFAEALAFFGDPDPRTGSPWDKGARLARLVACERNLLILDGLEPLQYPPGHQGGLAGQLKDPSLSALLKGLAERPHVGLCVVTSRQSITDLEANQGKTVIDWELERLDEAAGAALLAHLGVDGTVPERREVSRAVSGHALTLRLLGAWLKKAHRGDIRKWELVKFDKADASTQGGHAFKVMKAYEDWLSSAGEEGRRPLAVLRLLGLFDRPADPGCLSVLRSGPPIPGLTDTVVDLADEDWEAAVSDLEYLRLVARVPFEPRAVRGFDREAADRSGALGLPEPKVYLRPATSRGEALEVHPLVRDYFARQMRREAPESWRAAHSRLYEHLCKSPPYWPEELEGLEPLYQAIAHGCQAGLYREACDDVYRDRTLRGAGPGGFHSIRALGAVGADLGAVACFFAEPWRRLEPSLGEVRHAQLLGVAGNNLRALGRLTEALEPTRASIEMFVAQANWTYAALLAGQLSELELISGDIAAAVAAASKSVEYADLGQETYRRSTNRTTRADALYQSGQRAAAELLFREADGMQDVSRPDGASHYSASHYSWQVFRFCELLLSQAELAAWAQTLLRPASSRDIGPDALSEILADVRRRTQRALDTARKNRFLLDIALAHLTLARVDLFTSLLASGPETSTTRDSARGNAAAAVNGLRAASYLDCVPRGLLTRAWLSHVDGDAAGAESDLNAAWEIAERGPMPLHQADILLYRARLFADRTALARARELIEKHGYHRRDEELHDAEAALGSA
jgi:hypothetical protein